MPNYDIFPGYLVDPRDAKPHARVATTDVCRMLKITEPDSKTGFTKKRFGAQWFDEDVLGWCAKDGRTIFYPSTIAHPSKSPIRFCMMRALHGGIGSPRQFPDSSQKQPAPEHMNREQAERDRPTLRA